ncbi:YegP family protein [Shewanella sp. NKUCC06_TVS]|uniref:YegP family protein n=1 Tax=Shewanella sp. NKUCC06_TVS TaxID=2842128 RepID=UPI001C5B7A5C|nr:YegP family protein [Shewanella sp. NKUCC06_TVS]MBW3532986.1 YegP family protein [Shewanella sp. NKUCC06_TVS]
MTGWYELHRNEREQFYFYLRTGNGEIILKSELYTSKSGAENGIASVRHNCSLDVRYRRSRTPDGKVFFNLQAANYQIIGTSQIYSSEELRDRGITSVKENGQSTIVKNLS